MALLLTLLRRLLDPATILAARDILTFHLPLRTAAAELALLHGLPEWNPFLNGGQPILSNPNYAWFYPPTWLALVGPTSWAPSLIVLLHAAIAFGGAWRLLQKLGCEATAAALGAMGVAASPWFLSLAHTLNFLCATAWLPWVLATGRDAIQAAPGRRARSVLLTAALLALQLLAGEPVAVLVSGLALGCLALGSPRTLASSALRLVAVGAMAALLAAVQLVPTVYRLLGSQRGAGVAPKEAGLWSTHPARLVDFVLPRFWGDAMRDEGGLWLGWHVHDRSYPYVIGLYSGLLLTVLALAAIRWPVPHRAGWILAFLTGILLATGRHNPLWDPLRRLVPLLDLVRYPEKFLVLSAAVVPIAGALGWQHLSSADGRRHARGAAMLSGAVLAVAAGLAAALLARPELGRRFASANTGFPLSEHGLERVVGFLRLEALVTVALAAAVTTLLVAVRRRGVRTVLGTVAIAMVAADLAWYSWHLLPTAPASLLAPPPLARQAREAGGRLFSAEVATREPPIQLRLGPEGQQQLRYTLEMLFPYSGSLWGIPYALNVDYDLMLTAWAQHGVSVLTANLADQERTGRLLGAWDVRLLVAPREPSEVLAELQRTGRQPAQHRLLRNHRTLAPFRFVRRVGRVTSPRAALDALGAIEYDLRDRDFCLGPDAPQEADYAAARVLEVRDEGQLLRIHYRAEGPAFLVAAMTYDEGWTATVEGAEPVPTCPTAIGQIGIRVPAGEHWLRLRYRDPWVRVGGSVSLLALLASALAWRWRRSPPAEGAP